MIAFVRNPLRLVFLWMCLAGGSLSLASCQSLPPSPQNAASPPPAQTDRLDVTVSIPPQQYFVEKIGGDRLKVNVFVPGASDPHSYEPKPQQLQALSEADAYILVGLGFEKPWLERLKAANANMVLIDSSQGIKPLTMANDNHDHHDHGHDQDTKPNDQEQPSAQDPHIWLSPTLVKQQAKTIAANLSKIDPNNADYYQANLEKFLGEIDQLDQEIRQTLTTVKPRQFIVFHPSWGYFAQDYQLEQIPIEVDGQEPSAQELGELVDLAKKYGLKTIFAEPQFSPKNAEAIAAEIQGRIDTINPLAPNWSENLLAVAQQISQQNREQ